MASVKWQVIIGVIVIVFQVLILVFGAQGLEVVKDHAARIDGLERFQAGAWTVDDQREHEAAVASDIKEIRDELSRIRVAIERLR